MKKSLVTGFAAAAVILSLCLALLPSPWNPATLAKGVLRLATPLQPQLLLHDWIALLSWPAALLGLTVILLLAATVRHWAGPDQPRALSFPGIESPAPAPDPPASRRFLLAVLALTLAAGTLAWPRMNQSFWGDEDYTMRWHAHGHFKRDPDRVGGRLAMSPYFRELPWVDAFLGYRNTNNHFLLSLSAKANLALWQKATGAGRWEFRETIVRLTPFLAGLAGLAAWMLLLRRFGMPGLALLSGALLVLHPWFLRYLTEARGYGLVFLFLPLNLALLTRALATGKWRWWFGHALTQFLVLYSWPGMAFHVAGLNLVAAAAIFRLRRADPPDRSAQWLRWGIVNLLTVLTLAALTLPALPQVLAYLTDDQHVAPLDTQWHLDMVSHLFFGMHWQGYEPHGDNPLYITWTGLARTFPVIAPLFAGLTVLLGIVGVISLWRRSEAGRWIVLAIALPSIPFYAYSFLSGKYLFYWYLVYLLPVATLFLAAGAVAAARFFEELLPAPRPSRFFAPNLPLRRGTIFVMAFLAAYAVATHPKRRVLRAHSLDPLRESVLRTRTSLDPFDESQTRLLTGHLNFPAVVYDACGYLLHEEGPRESRSATARNVEPSLARMMQWSDAYDLPLLINVGYPSDARREFPNTMKLLEQDQWFEKTDTLWALEPQFDRVIYRYRGGFW